MKRHISDSPQAAVVLNCKKRKTEIASASGETSTILKFAGTVSEVRITQIMRSSEINIFAF